MLIIWTDCHHRQQSQNVGASVCISILLGGTIMSSSQLLPFASDYMEGAHPAILKRLTETNRTPMPGYGTDAISEAARAKIRAACQCPEADVYFLVGGTQTNATVIDALLASYQGVVATDTGHISLHEAGAIEFGGHKVLTLPHQDGKLRPEDVDAYLTAFAADGNRDHMVMPGMVYISHPTEYGTLYTAEELRRLHAICQAHKVPLYLDGARLAYALACPENDVSLPLIAAYCDAFYIGGTKCGTLFGEAVVFPQKNRAPHFFTIMKQHGALLAKGWLLGLQFDTLFTDGLYEQLGKPAIEAADTIRKALQEYGYRLFFQTPTNQIFVIMANEQLEHLAKKVSYSFWEPYDDAHTVIRLATSWATTDDEVHELTRIIKELVQ